MFFVPKAILDDMLHAALQLRSAVSCLRDAALGPTLDGLLRRIFVAKVLAQTWVVAVGGGQGAGKTTLVRQLYGLDGGADDWLPANEGQGERLPVLVQETADVDVPQGWVYRLLSTDDGFSVCEEPVDVAGFHQAARGNDASLLLPVLKVPPRHFSAMGVTLLLLPGYEQKHRQNAAWQELMRQSLASAGACVIVTDQTRLANNVSQDILRDQEFSVVEPVVVITKTEETDEDGREALRRQAAHVFSSSGGQVGGVVCTGLGAAFTESWSRELVVKIDRAANSASRVQELRVEHLTGMLEDLQALLLKVEEEIAARGDAADDTWDRVVDRFFVPYDKAAKKLKRTYHRQLIKALAAHREDAGKHLLKAIKPDEGVRGLLSAWRRSESEKLEHQRELIEGVWRKPGDCQECHLQALTQASFERLSASVSGLSDLKRQTFGSRTNLVMRTGYEVAQSGLSSDLSSASLDNLNILLTPGDDRSLTETVDRDIAFLPALALEFSRLVQLAVVGHRASPDASQDDADITDVARHMTINFTAMMSMHHEVVRAVATVFGLKSGEDLHNTLNATRKKLATAKNAGGVQRVTGGLLIAADLLVTGLGVAAAAAAAVVAVALLVRAAEKEQLASTEAILDILKEEHEKTYLSSFDDVMERVRDRMTETLRARFKLDRNVYELDRVAQAASRLRRSVGALDSALPRLA